MFMPQTLQEYLDNPMGKGSTAIMNRQLIKSDLDTRFEKLLKENKKFEYKVYQDKFDYYFHFMIPSESERNNTYDVVLQFTKGEHGLIEDPSLKNYTLKFFSNCPSFVYTYAYVYNDYELMIDFLKGKYDDITLTDSPITRNPGEIINFEKSIYFACKYLDSNKTLMNKIVIAATVKKLNKNELFKKIRATSTIMLEIKKENNRLKDDKKKKTEPIKKSRDLPLSNKVRGSKSSGVTKINKIKPLKKIQGKKKIGGR